MQAFSSRYRKISKVGSLGDLDGEILVPEAVAEEISDEPAASRLSNAADDWLEITCETPDRFDEAATGGVALTRRYRKESRVSSC